MHETFCQNRCCSSDCGWIKLTSAFHRCQRLARNTQIETAEERSVYPISPLPPPGARGGPLFWFLRFSPLLSASLRFFPFSCFSPCFALPRNASQWRRETEHLRRAVWWRNCKLEPQPVETQRGRKTKRKGEKREEGKQERLADDWPESMLPPCFVKSFPNNRAEEFVDGSVAFQDAARKLLHCAKLFLSGSARGVLRKLLLWRCVSTWGLCVCECFKQVALRQPPVQDALRTSAKFSAQSAVFCASCSAQVLWALCAMTLCKLLCADCSLCVALCKLLCVTVSALRKSGVAVCECFAQVSSHFAFYFCG